MNQNRSRFQRGSGCFKCSRCGKQTRSTGDNGGTGLCPACYDKAGDENAVSDGQMTVEAFRAAWGCDPE